MCGIVGIVTQKSFDPQHLTQATQALHHRGPDASGYYTNDNYTVGLGHTRLSILDLSSSANQPFVSDDGRYIMVYNGEVYNFKEISDELRGVKNNRLRSTGDTEIILKAFEYYGESFVDKLNGMFAIAIYDNRQHKLTLYRDRLGIKPLFYFWDNTTFLFSSELKALTKWHDITKSLNPNFSCLSSFLQLGYIPEPSTIYENIRKFPAGHKAIFEKNRLEILPYWQLKNQIAGELISDFDYAKQLLKDTLSSSVSQRMISDVPLGAFLSGGIDSSLVTAIAASISSTPIRTFSIGFKEQQFNESHHAEQIAEYLSTNHRTFMLSEKQAIPLIDEVLSTFDEPFADSSAIPMLLLSKLVSKEVKVVLTGDGGDEQFQGYGAYRWATRLDSAKKLAFVFPMIRSMLRMGKSRAKRVSHMFDKTGLRDINTHVFSQEQYYFSKSELPELLIRGSSEDIFVHEPDYVHSQWNAADVQAYFDINNYLKDDLLVKVDRSTMRFGLEARVPLLDHRLVSLSSNLDFELKYHGQSKALLKSVLFDYLPEHLFDRPKWGFGAPLSKWLKNEMAYLIDDYLNIETLERFPFFNEKIVRSYVNRFRAGENYLYNRLWLMILWNKWHLDNEMPSP